MINTVLNPCPPSFGSRRGARDHARSAQRVSDVDLWTFRCRRCGRWHVGDEMSASQLAAGAIYSPFRRHDRLPRPQ